MFIPYDNQRINEINQRDVMFVVKVREGRVKLGFHWILDDRSTKDGQI